MQCTGAKILMECLVEQGVDTIFGYPGGTILNLSLIHISEPTRPY